VLGCVGAVAFFDDFAFDKLEPCKFRVLEAPCEGCLCEADFVARDGVSGARYGVFFVSLEGWSLIGHFALSVVL
jgi:hypothetical protein